MRGSGALSSQTLLLAVYSINASVPLERPYPDLNDPPNGEDTWIAL